MKKYYELESSFEAAVQKRAEKDQDELASMKAKVMESDQ